MPERVIDVASEMGVLILRACGIAGLLGFTGIAAGSADIAKVSFFIFLVIFAVVGILAVTAERSHDRGGTGNRPVADGDCGARWMLEYCRSWPGW